MNARQKAKKYKRELNRLKGLSNSGKIVKVPYTKVRYCNEVCIRYNIFEHSEPNISEVKDRMLEPLVKKLKDNMKIEVTQDEINQVFHCRGYLNIYVESEDKE